MTADDLRSLLASWMIHLRAERKSPQTITAYSAGVRLYLEWCNRQDLTPTLDRATVKAWVAELLDRGAEAATARARLMGLKRFSAWLAEEGEIPRDDLLGVKPPKLDQKVTESLTDEQLAALIKACAGSDFRDRRDEAIVRLMAETAARVGEVVAMAMPDVDLTNGVAIVRRGKGGKGRPVPFGPRTGRALDRYLRMRRSHRLADGSALWLGDRGKTLAYYGLRDTLNYRAGLAGIKDFHPHLLRHTAAARWLDAGGSEGGLMAVAGWSRREMLDRYVRATSQRRAADEARRLGLGDRI